MKKYKLYSLIIAVIFSATNIHAQTLDDNYSEVRSYLNSMFQQLNKNRVPTGILLDYGIDLVDMEDYDGTVLADSTYVNVDIYRDILKTIISSDVKTNYNSSYNSVKAKIDALDNVSVDGPIKLSAAFFQYNVIKSNAIEDNLIVYDEVNNKVCDAYNDNGWINPYDTKNLFAVTVGAQSSDSSSVQYVLPDEYYFTNSSITQMYFDAGDGLGYRPCLKNSTISVNYTTEGIKTLKLRIRTLQGQYLESHTYIQIKFPNVSIQGGSIYTTEDYTETIDGITLSARIVYDSSISSQIRKPFIVVEGFDPWMLQNIYQSDTNNGYNPYPQSNIHTGYTDYEDYKYVFNNILHDEYGYDVIYVDWDNCTADIKKNAILLQKIIEDINLQKAVAGSTEKNVILGLSMGGLISRYALRNMEQNGTKHEVATYISGDTPHLGVNVPIGLQIFIEQLLSFVHGFDTAYSLFDEYLSNRLSEGESIIKDVLYSDAARQMMYYSAIGTDIIDYFHVEWQEELDRIGFPSGDNNEGIELLALTNNSSYEHIYGLIQDDSGDEHLLYIDGYAKASVLLDFVFSFYQDFFDMLLDNTEIEEVSKTLGSNRIEIDAEVNLLRSENVGKPLSKLKVIYSKKFLWLDCFEKRITIFDSEVNIPSVPLYYEDFPGSVYTLNSSGSHHYNGNASNLLGKYQYQLGFKSNIMFVPTASALNIIGGGRSEYKQDFNNNLLIPKVDIPFDSYHIDNSLDENIDTKTHINFSDYAYRWLSNQINMTIEGPDFVPLKGEYLNLSGVGQYRISGLEVSDNLNWYVSNESIAKIDRTTGKLTAVSNGIVQITAQYHVRNTLYRKTKNVYIGFPDFAITKRYIPGEGYKFTATLAGDTNVGLSELNENMGIKYEWYTIDSNGNCVPIPDAENADSYSYLPSGEEVITIVLRLVDNSGNSSPMRSITINMTVPFEVNYQYVVIDANKNIHFMKTAGGFDTGLPNEDFTITFRNVILNDNDNILTNISRYIKGNKCYMSCYNTNSNTGVSVVGNKVRLVDKWTFNLFDQNIFVASIADALENSNGERKVLTEYELVIMNSELEALQRVPFRIIYNPMFITIPGYPRF